MLKTNMTTQIQNPPATNKKRRADESSQLSDSETDGTSSNSYPTFLVVEPKNGQTIKLSIFAIQKLLKCAVGDVKSAKKLRNGSILLEVCSKAQATNALKMTTWVDTPVSVTPHRSLNSCKGIIRCRDLRDCSEDEILGELSHEGVTHVNK